MSFIKNFPLFSIILTMFSAILTSVVNGKWARRICLSVVSLVLAMSLALSFYCHLQGSSITYLMGHFPAPWGNEIRFGELEALMASFFSLIMLFSLMGGMTHIFADIEDTKTNLFFVLTDLMMSSLLALIYTNDLFTGYVFVEINTIAAAGMIMIRQRGHSLVASVRYLILSQIGSGLFLISLCFLYGITGQLLMMPAGESVKELVASSAYSVPLLVSLGLMAVGMAIKSGLYPFHAWIPDTYGYSTAAGSAILSSLASKGYIFLLIKVFFRVFGFSYVSGSHILNALFVFGLVAMIMGSVQAIRQMDTRKMIAYSSVAQIGYIYMGIGLGSEAGVAAAVFHILCHAATKSMLFISSVGLYEVSNGKTDYLSLRGAGYRNRLAGIAFSVGALSMVGFPMLSGFISKLLFAQSAMGSPRKMIPALVVLTISTILNAIYFLRMVITLYSPEGSGTVIEVPGDKGEYLSKEELFEKEREKEQAEGFFLVPKSKRLVEMGGAMSAALILMILLNFVLGLFSGPILETIYRGLAMLS